MKRLPPLVALFTVVGAIAGCSTQASTGEIERLERERIEASRTGRSLTAFNADDYFDVIPPGTPRTNKDVEQGTPRPNAYDAPELHIRMIGNAAVVTGTMGGPGTAGLRDRILRVWLKGDREW